MTYVNKGGEEMPNHDKTGPTGQGSMTGKQMGHCEGARSQFGMPFQKGTGCHRRRVRYFQSNTYQDIQKQNEELISRIEKLEEVLNNRG